MKTISKIAASSAVAVVLMCSSVGYADHGHGGGSHWGFSIGVPWPGYYSYPYYAPYYPYGYYYPPAYYPPPVQYSSPPPVVYQSPTPSTPDSPDADRPLPPSTVYKGSAGYPENTPEQAPKRSNPPAQPTPPVQPLSLADVKTLVKAGMSEEVVMSQIKQSRTVYRLTTAEILDLKESGVSNRVIDFMINTESRR